LKFILYIRYFFYLAINWHVKIAWYIIRQEIKGEKKYGINTTGADELRSLEKKGIDTEHATIYMPVNYGLLEEIFDQLKISSFHHFLDIGCGKGRAMCVAANKGFAKVSGIDFSKEFCDAAIKNLAFTKQKFPLLNYSVINNDAFYYAIPDDVDCIFLFNPFDEIIMGGVIENIRESFGANPRKITVIYANPMYKDLFLAEGFTKVFATQKMNYLEAAIYEN
jgi:SAM-dependent methyltransferase